MKWSALLQIVFETPKGQNDQSFLALDQFVFLQESTCGLMPAQAAPTPAPTEPPLRKRLVLLKYRFPHIFR